MVRDQMKTLSREWNTTFTPHVLYNGTLFWGGFFFRGNAARWVALIANEPIPDRANGL